VVQCAPACTGQGPAPHGARGPKLAPMGFRPARPGFRPGSGRSARGPTAGVDAQRVPSGWVVCLENSAPCALRRKPVGRRPCAAAGPPAGIFMPLGGHPAMRVCLSFSFLRLAALSTRCSRWQGPRVAVLLAAGIPISSRTGQRTLVCGQAKPGAESRGQERAVGGGGVEIWVLGPIPTYFLLDHTTRCARV